MLVKEAKITTVAKTDLNLRGCFSKLKRRDEAISRVSVLIIWLASVVCEFPHNTQALLLDESYSAQDALGNAHAPICFYAVLPGIGIICFRDLVENFVR